jgi:hypothetical protein
MVYGQSSAIVHCVAGVDVGALKGLSQYKMLFGLPSIDQFPAADGIAGQSHPAEIAEQVSVRIGAGTSKAVNEHCSEATRLE